MKFSDDILMAYADGELDAATRAEIKAALASDPELAASIARQRVTRELMRRGFDPILDEPVPDRLLDAIERGATGPTGAEVRPLRPEVTAPPRSRRWSWPEWTAMAATLVAGALIGAGLRPAPSPLWESFEDRLVASGELSRALSSQLSRDAQPGTAIRPGVSFRTASGDYCRAFISGRVAGLACREEERWQVELLSTLPEAQAEGYRPAGAALPGVILEAVEARIDGDPLDAEGEAAARDRGWRN